MMRKAVLCAMLGVLTLAAAYAQEPPGGDATRPPDDTTPAPATTPPVLKPVTRENIQEAISRGVETILGTQQDDGSFRLSPQLDKTYPVGITSLGVLALQHARPHLTGDVSARAAEAVRKGLARLSQMPFDGKTYSAGFGICAFFKEHPRTYSKEIDRFAGFLVNAQHKRRNLPIYGQWGYLLYDAKVHGTGATIERIRFWADNSNNQIAILGLYQASRAGFQVPRKTWERAREAYLTSQNPDGGWGYTASHRPESYANMTIAGTISLYICEEMLNATQHTVCRPPPPSPGVDKGIKWIVDHFEGLRVDTYGMYALERLGIIMGQSTIGGHDWFDTGARTLLNLDSYPALFATPEVGACFAVLYLARGLEPVVFGKLRRRDTDDWNNDPYDVKHLTEYITDHYQEPVQWRIVQLDAPVEMLLRIPILCLSGHDRLDFNVDEKAKLKACVTGGGTILAQTCCQKQAFERSFRELVEGLFGTKLETLPAEHPIYTRMKTRGLSPHPKIEVITLADQGGRPGVIYLDRDHCCRWHVGNSQEAFAVGTGICLYVTTDARKMFERSRDAAAK